MMQDRLAAAVLRLQRIMARLRAPDGCPWDACQDSASLKPYLVEETYEVLEAIDGGDSQEICGELGDLLLQVVFHAQIHAEQRRFDLADVATAISDKLVRRHPHVFAEVEETDLEALSAQWERIKGEEKVNGRTRSSALDGIPAALPALLRAEKLLERGERVGLAQPSAEDGCRQLTATLARLQESENQGCPRPSPQAEELLGDHLLATVRWGRRLGLNAEDALRQAAARFEAGFRARERQLEAEERSLSALPGQEQLALWPGQDRRGRGGRT